MRISDWSSDVCSSDLPANNPRYAASCILEHSGHMATAAPIVSDVLTFLYDKDKAMAKLTALEKTWGGPIDERMDANIQRYKHKAVLEQAIRRGEVILPSAITIGGRGHDGTRSSRSPSHAYPGGCTLCSWPYLRPVSATC